MAQPRSSTACPTSADASALSASSDVPASSGVFAFPSFGKYALRSAIGALLCALVPGSTESAIANGDTRTIELYNQHTQESISATYRVNGQYDQAVLEKLNWFLRDWRRNEATKMDPRLFDAVWETYRTAGATQPITVVCGYRSPQTNAMLRRRSRMVAEHSQHMLGKAMDTRMPGMSMEQVREIAMRLQMGGVGFYGDSAFVHIDVGGVRYWPRMTYAQLEHVFPDGKSVLMASDGRKLPGYEEARAELAANGRAIAPSEPAQAPNFFAWLFGGGKSDGDADAEGAQQQVAAAAPAPQPQQTAAEAPPPSKLASDERTGASGTAESPEAPSARRTLAAATDEPAAEIPAPPHRPTDFLALVDVPLPPGRPTLETAAAETPLPPTRSAYFAPETTGSLGNSAPEQVAGLPSIITHGASESALAKRGAPALRTAPQVLAYAPVAQMEGLRSAVHGKPKGEAPLAMARPDHDAMLSPTLTGLRRAGQIETAALSQKLAAGYLARFGKVASNLPTDHFVGPAVVGLRAADRSHMMFIDNAVALKSQ